MTSRWWFPLLGIVTSIGAANAQMPALSFDRIDAMRLQGQFTRVAGLLEDMNTATPGQADVLWRLSRTYVDQGEQAADEHQKRIYFNRAVPVAEEAVQVDRNNVECHLALAIAAGRLALVSPARQKVRLARQVKASLDRIIEINPDFGYAYHVRGRWYFAVASLNFFERTLIRLLYGGMPEASFQLAARDFEKAASFGDRIVNRLELARTYFQLGEEAKARFEVQVLLRMPERDPDDPTHKREARALLDP